MRIACNPGVGECLDIDWEGGMNDWRERFSEYFCVQLADTPELIREAMALRYQIYCKECEYENPRVFRDGLEKDKFDQGSVQALLRHRATREVAGTVRLIRPNQEVENGLLPVELNCQIDSDFRKKLSHVHRERIAEISRFAVSKQFRRRLYESHNVHGVAEMTGVLSFREERRSLMPLMTLGLLRAIFIMSYEQNVTYWVAVMEPQLLRLLKGLGVVLTQVGPVANYHGDRIPCAGAVSDVLAGLRKSRPDIWGFVNMGDIKFPEPSRQCGMDINSWLVAGA